VPDKAVRLVLGGDPNAVNAGIEGVREREVDNAGLAAEIDGRFGAIVTKFVEPAPASAREHIGHRRAGKGPGPGMVDRHGNASSSFCCLLVAAPLAVLVDVRE
jgi:hypothetical protein